MLSSFLKTASTQPSPVISQLRPDRHFGSISEHMNKIIDNYMAANPDKVSANILCIFTRLDNNLKTVLSIMCLLSYQYILCY